MNRIVVIGCSGAGKTSLARTLAEKYDLPLVSLDHLYWQPGWVAAAPEIFAQDIADATAQPRWVMDGTYAKTLVKRIERADLVIFLDFNRWRCAANIFLRRWQMSPEQAPGCPANISYELFYYVLRSFPGLVRPALIDLHGNTGDPRKWVILKNRRAVRGWLNGKTVNKKATPL